MDVDPPDVIDDCWIDEPAGPDVKDGFGDDDPPNSIEDCWDD